MEQETLVNIMVGLGQYGRRGRYTK